MANIFFLDKKGRQSGIYVIYYKTIKFTDMELQIMNYELLQMRDPTLEERIFDVLRELSVPVGCKGHKYLIDAIQTAVREPQTLSSINKKIFPRIAETYDTTVSCVESAIRSAITRAWTSGDPLVQQKHFGHTVNFSSGRPSDAEFIAMIANIPDIRRAK